jgi:threonine dehydratase
MVNRTIITLMKNPSIPQSSDLKAARAVLGPALGLTPCLYSEALSEITGARIYCKMDNLLRTGSFKERGARFALSRLSPEAARKGVIAASAGNHALGLAWHGSCLGIPVTVVMPRSAPLIKRQNCLSLGARVVLEGHTFEEARKAAFELADKENLTYINGFDHPDVIAGQATMGMEILEQVPECDAIVVPVGGGGLLAGIVLAVEESGRPIELLGVEARRAASFQFALERGQPETFGISPTLADGLAVSKVGSLAYEIIAGKVGRWLQVEEDAIALAMLRFIEWEKAVVEGAAATSLAAFLGGGLQDLRGKTVVLPLCGGNVDPLILGRVMEKGLAQDGRLCRFTTHISDRPGGLATFTALLASQEVGIKDITHDRAFSGADISRVQVFCTVETRDAEHRDLVFEYLKEKGYPTQKV